MRATQLNMVPDSPQSGAINSAALAAAAANGTTVELDGHFHLNTSSQSLGGHFDVHGGALSISSSTTFVPASLLSVRIRGTDVLGTTDTATLIRGGDNSLGTVHIDGGEWDAAAFCAVSGGPDISDIWCRDVIVRGQNQRWMNIDGTNITGTGTFSRLTARDCRAVVVYLDNGDEEYLGDITITGCNMLNRRGVPMDTQGTYGAFCYIGGYRDVTYTHNTVKGVAFLPVTSGPKAGLDALLRAHNVYYAHNTSIDNFALSNQGYFDLIDCKRGREGSIRHYADSDFIVTQEALDHYGCGHMRAHFAHPPDGWWAAQVRMHGNRIAVHDLALRRQLAQAHDASYVDNRFDVGAVHCVQNDAGLANLKASGLASQRLELSGNIIRSRTQPTYTTSDSLSTATRPDGQMWLYPERDGTYIEPAFSGLTIIERNDWRAFVGEIAPPPAVQPTNVVTQLIPVEGSQMVTKSDFQMFKGANLDAPLPGSMPSGERTVRFRATTRFGDPDSISLDALEWTPTSVRIVMDAAETAEIETGRAGFTRMFYRVESVGSDPNDVVRTHYGEVRVNA